MIESFINQLVKEDLTTIQELEEITGRSTSTVYRWINNEGSLDCVDFHNLLRYMKNPAATRGLLGLMTAELPVVISWLETQEEKAFSDSLDRSNAARETVAATVLALECVSMLLTQQHTTLEDDQINREEYSRFIGLIDDAVAHLVQSKQQLKILLTERTKAKPLASPP